MIKINYKGTTKLETARLILRRFKITREKDMFENYGIKRIMEQNI